MTVALVATIACAIAGVATTPGAASRREVHARAGKVVASIPVPPGGGGLAVGAGAVWSASNVTSTLTRIDPGRNMVVDSSKVGRVNACPEFPRSCGEVAAGNGAVWVSRPSDGTVLRVDPQSNSISATIQVGPDPTPIAVTPGAIWVANIGGPSVSRIDPATNRVVATISVGPADGCCFRHMAMSSGGGSVWVTVPKMRALVRIDPAINAVTATIRLPQAPCGLVAADAHAVWAAGGYADDCASDVARVDAATNRRAGTVKGLEGPIGLALGFGSLWVADLGSKEIDRVNLRTRKIVARLPVRGVPISLAVGFGSVWVRDDTGRVLRIKPQP